MTSWTSFKTWECTELECESTQYCVARARAKSNGAGQRVESADTRSSRGCTDPWNSQARLNSKLAVPRRAANVAPRLSHPSLSHGPPIPTARHLLRGPSGDIKFRKRISWNPGAQRFNPWPVGTVTVTLFIHIFHTLIDLNTRRSEQRELRRTCDHCRASPNRILVSALAMTTAAYIHAVDCGALRSELVEHDKRDRKRSYI